MNASAFSVGSADHGLRIEQGRGTTGSRMILTSAELNVEVEAMAVPNGVELSARVIPQKGTVLGVSLPARLRFGPMEVERLVCPADGNMSVGAAFRRGFFEPSPPDKPAGWQSETLGGKGYATLFSGGPEMRSVQDEPVALSVTPEGRAWLGLALATRQSSPQP